MASSNTRVVHRSAVQSSTGCVWVGVDSPFLFTKRHFMEGNRKRELSTDTDNTDVSFSSPPTNTDRKEKKDKKKVKMAEVSDAPGVGVGNKGGNKDGDLSMILKSLNDLNRKNDDLARKLENVATKEDVKSIREDLDRVNKSLTNRIDGLEARIYTLEKDRDGLTNKVDALKREKGDLEDKLSGYEQKLINCERNANDHEQHGRGWNLRFFGLPEEVGKKETISDCIDKVVELVNDELGMEIDKNCIEIAHRTGQRQRDSRDGEHGGEHGGASADPGARGGRGGGAKAGQQVMKALRYSYVGRKRRKRDFRSLWICRVNAASRTYGLNYSKLRNLLKCSGVEINLKMLAQLSILDKNAFSTVLDTVVQKK